MNRERIHSTATSQFFQTFVQRYPDKQYQSWIGGHHIRLGIDYDYDGEVLRNVAAAVVSHYSDYSFASALRTLKQHQRKEATLPRFEKVFDLIEDRFHSTSLGFLQSNRPDNLAEEHNGIIHAEIFLLRLLSSLEAARKLINWGFFPEPLMILRSGLEQLAWAHAVGINFNKQQLESPNPPKCIGTFKNCFSSAGLLYGALSRFSHMDFEAQKHFVLAHDDKSPGAGVMQKSIEFKFFGLLFYSLLLIAFQYVCRDIQKFYSERYDLQLHLSNSVLPLRILVEHALMQPELDKDEIAAVLTEIYFNVFTSRIGKP